MLEALFTDAAIGLGLFDPELRYLRVNDVLQSIIGIPVEQLYGRTAREVLPDFGDTAPPPQRDALDTGVPARDIKLWGRTPAHPGPRRCYSCSYFRLHAPDGTVLGLASIVTDITESRRSTEALAAASERLALLSRVGQIVGSSLSTRDTLSALAAVTVPRFADHCIVDLIDEHRPGGAG